MIKNKKNLFLIIPLFFPLFTTGTNCIKIDSIMKDNEINSYKLQAVPNNVEQIIAAIKKKLKDKKIKFYNIDDWNNLAATKSVVLTQIINIINNGGIFSNGIVLAFDQSQLEIQKISYNLFNKQVNLDLSYYKRNFKVAVFLDTQLENHDYIIAITERIKQLNISKKMLLFQKTGENINKLIKTEIYQWISDHLKTVEFKLNDKKIDVDLKLISLLAFKNQIAKEKKIIATIDYKNFTASVDISSEIIDIEKFGKSLQAKINTLKITLDKTIDYTNIFSDSNMKLIINKIIDSLGYSIEIDNLKLLLNIDSFEPIAFNDQEKSKFNPWVEKVNLKFRHKKTNLVFNSTINFTYDKTEKENLFTSIFQSKVNDNVQFTSGNDLLFLNSNNLKSKILAKLKDCMDTNFSGKDYKFMFDYQQLNISDYKIIKENNKVFIKVFFKYGQIIVSNDQYIKIPVNIDQEFYQTNFEKIYQLIQKEIPEYSREAELRPDVNPTNAIEWINNKIKSTIKSIKINEIDTEIEWGKFTFTINSSLPVHINIDGNNYFVFTLSYKDSTYDVEFKDSFYILSPYQEINPETTPIEIVYNFLTRVYKDMQTYFALIHQTGIDNLNFKALKERFQKLVVPESNDVDEWKIVNFFGYLTNIYLDFLKDIILKLTNINYSNFVFAESKVTEPSVKRFQIKMELTLKDDIKKVSEILNNSWYQELFEQIDWTNPLKGVDYGEFFDKVYKLNNDLIKNSIKYILK